MSSMENKSVDNKDNISATEQVNPLLQKGQERVNALKASISNAKDKISSWWSRKKAAFTGGVEKVAVVVAASPEIGVAAANAASEKVEQFSTAVETKIENTVNAVGAGITKAEQWVGAKKQEAFNWANDKKEQMVQFGKDTIEITSAVAEVAKEVASEKYAEAKEVTIAKIAEVKEKIQSKWERLLDFGRTAIAAAEAKRQAIIEKRRAEMNAAKLAQLQSWLDAHDDAENEALQKVEAVRNSRTMVQSKIDELQKAGLYNSSAVAA